MGRGKGLVEGSSEEIIWSHERKIALGSLPVPDLGGGGRSWEKEEGIISSCSAWPRFLFGAVKAFPVGEPNGFLGETKLIVEGGAKISVLSLPEPSMILAVCQFGVKVFFAANALILKMGPDAPPDIA